MQLKMQQLHDLQICERFYQKKKKKIQLESKFTWVLFLYKRKEV